MLETIANVLQIFWEHYQDIIVCGLIMVSAIIVAIGFLKPFVFNKIKNKNLRKATLAFTNVGACFATVFVYFLVKGFPLENYWVTATALAITSILVYWFYENTCLRNLIELIGNLVLRRVLKASLFALTTEDINAVKEELKNTSEELKAFTKTEFKKATNVINEDKDLEGL